MKNFLSIVMNAIRASTLSMIWKFTNQFIPKMGLMFVYIVRRIVKVSYSSNVFLIKHSKSNWIFCIAAALKLRRHVRIHFLDKPHKCTVCDKGFPEMGSLTRHFRRHTGIQRERKHVCSICNKAYYDSHTLNIHIRSHTGKSWQYWKD